MFSKCDKLAALVAVVAILTSATAPIAQAAQSDTIRQQFASPPRHFATAPLWVWNDLLTEDQIRSTLRDLASQEVKQVFVHPRPGLMTPYLSEDWFRLWEAALDEAERLDMNVWIYDENSYPSGFAGGLVPEQMPDARAKGLVFETKDTVQAVGDDVLAVFQLKGTTFKDVTQLARNGSLPKGNYLVARIRLAPASGWFGGKFYVDLLKPGVTEKFLEITLDAYRKHVGAHFGKRIPGSFTDEPRLTIVGNVHWSDNLPGLFQQRFGYDLVEHLPCLVRRVGPWKQVRHDFYLLLLEQFIERWCKPYYEYCDRVGLEFTGHFWEHAWPNANFNGDTMACYAWQHRPGIDILMNRYSESVHAQFGNVRSVLELASVANQLGKRRTLCEVYGAGGWDLRFQDMKRIGDWIVVLGVNTLDEHLSYITIRGVRKYDHPQSFSYHEPWWQHYHVLARYFTRLCLVLSSGEQINRILVIEPTTTAWMYQHDRVAEEIGQSFQEFVTRLSQQQVEFDLGCEYIIKHFGLVKESKNGHCTFAIGRRQYDVVVLPPRTENLEKATLDLLEQFAKQGGTVLYCDKLPDHVDGRPISEALASRAFQNWQQINSLDIGEQLLKQCPSDVVVTKAAESGGILYHHRRQLEDGQFLFLVNTSMDEWCTGTVQAPFAFVEHWDAFTGQIKRYPAKRKGKDTVTRFELPPCGSLLLFLTNEERQLEEARLWDLASGEPIKPTGQMQAVPQAPNVLTLDFVDVQVRDQRLNDTYCYAACRFVFQMHDLPGNPWDRAVQFRDSLLKLQFPANSGFTARYKFQIEKALPDKLLLVVERPDLYSISCNGKPVTTQPGQWWLDKSFGVLDISQTIRLGENAIELSAQPLSVFHELQPVYLLGNFCLEPRDTGFVIVPARPLTVPSRKAQASEEGKPAPEKQYGWNVQGYPFYAGPVTYRQVFELPKIDGEYFVQLNKWNGSVAFVTVNGKEVGVVFTPPYRCRVTKMLKPGKNVVEVMVIGTLKNTLGPHHAGTVRGSAWPSAFQRAPRTGPPPGAAYDTIAYGLFEPFDLIRIR